MDDDRKPRARYGEAFWRAHHEAWQRSDLNQREYCESQGIGLKAFGNWRAKFKAEPEAARRKLRYRRGGARHSLSHKTAAFKSGKIWNMFLGTFNFTTCLSEESPTQLTHDNLFQFSNDRLLSIGVEMAAIITEAGMQLVAVWA